MPSRSIRRHGRRTSMAKRVVVIGWLALALVTACTQEDKAKPEPKAADAATAAAPPKNLDLAKAALVSAKAKYAKHEAGDADCAPLRSLEADFAQDKSPAAVKTTREIDVFCDIDVKLEGS